MLEFGLGKQEWHTIYTVSYYFSYFHTSKKNKKQKNTWVFWFVFAYPLWLFLLVFQPPPPGHPPNAAQLAAMQGANVVMAQRKNNFFLGSSGGGYTIW